MGSLECIPLAYDFQCLRPGSALVIHHHEQVYVGVLRRRAVRVRAEEDYLLWSELFADPRRCRRVSKPSRVRRSSALVISVLVHTQVTIRSSSASQFRTVPLFDPDARIEPADAPI